MYRVGLTGGIGSGKSTVARIFGILGVPVYYADTEAKRLMNTDEMLKNGISGLFGPGAYTDGILNNSYLASRAFPDPALLSSLNALVHPAVHRDFNRWCEERTHFPYVIEEAAILIESGARKQFDFIVVVYADEETRIGRVSMRDGAVEAGIRERMKRQMSPQELNSYADHIIDNNGKQLLIPQVLELHGKFVSLQFS